MSIKLKMSAKSTQNQKKQNKTKTLEVLEKVQGINDQK